MQQEIKVRYSTATDTLSIGSYDISCYALANGFLFANHCGGQLSQRQLLNQADPVNWLESEAQKAVEATQRLLDDGDTVSKFTESAKKYGRKTFNGIESAMLCRISAANQISISASEFITFLRGAK